MMNTYLASFARRTRSLWAYLSLALIVALLLAACGGGGTTTASTPTATSQPTPTPTQTSTVANVKIVEQNGKYSFQPATLSIKMGTQVEWLNTSDAPHTVTSDTAGVFGSTSNISKNQTFKFTFTKAGTYSYVCLIHPKMGGTVKVT